MRAAALSSYPENQIPHSRSLLPSLGDDLKLIAEKDTRRLIGGQIVGYSGAAMRIDMLATAITMGATVEQLLNMDLAYSPPFSPVWDPVLIALNQF